MYYDHLTAYTLLAKLGRAGGYEGASCYHGLRGYQASLAWRARCSSKRIFTKYCQLQ